MQTQGKSGGNVSVPSGNESFEAGLCTVVPGILSTATQLPRAVTGSVGPKELHPSQSALLVAEREGNV